MAEYKVKFHISVDSLWGSIFGPRGNDLEIIEANSAQEAKEKFTRLAKVKLGMHYDEVVIKITDVEKV